MTYHGASASSEQPSGEDEAVREACPYLPSVSPELRAAALRRFGKERGAEFYLGCLECAQALWLRGLPAQSVLLLNRAFASDLQGDDPVLRARPLPYAAMLWVLRSARPGDFLGNPRRHFQHLATRMVEPRRELRSARAWACWAFAREVFPSLPGDERQLREEGVSEPGLAEIRGTLLVLGLPGEASLWEQVLGAASPHPESGALKR